MVKAWVPVHLMSWNLVTYKNENIGTFTNERDAVDWIYSNLNNDEVGISIDKAPELVDTLINKERYRN